MVMDIRSIEDEDVDRVIQIYKSSYGDDYPYKDFYKAAWVRKGVYSDDLTWLVAESDKDLNGSSALMLQAGDHDDLMGEFGRLAVTPSSRKGGVGRALMGELDAEAPKYIEFGFAEARTVHGGSQKLLEELGFTALGFEPMKYQLAHRESFIYYGKLYGHAAKLRNKRPLIIPQVDELANAAVNGMNLDCDIQVDPYAGRYPIAKGLTIESIDEFLMPRLLKISYGRVVTPEIFGSLHLNYGFFKIASQNAKYLIAKKNGEPVGAIGYTEDPIDSKLKIFEMIAEDDFVKGYMLNEVTALAMRTNQAYVEADVSAYSPRMQKTLLDLGFVPVAYLPGMVFQDIERLDIIRFAKINRPYDLKAMVLTDVGKAAFNRVNKFFIK